MTDISLTPGQQAALLSMLSPSWTIDGPTIRSLVQLGLAEWTGTAHRLTSRGLDLAGTLMLMTRSAGAA